MVQRILTGTLLVGLFAMQAPMPPARVAAQKPVAQPIDVSVVQLIATPERFDGKPIRVIGFLRLEFEGNALYLHETDFCHGITANAVWVDVTWRPDDKQFASNNTYVLMEGVFDARSKGHMGLFSGSIQKVTRLAGWNPDAEPARCYPNRR